MVRIQMMLLKLNNNQREEVAGMVCALIESRANNIQRELAFRMQTHHLAD
jgi:hypothetical protein